MPFATATILLVAYMESAVRVHDMCVNNAFYPDGQQLQFRPMPSCFEGYGELRVADDVVALAADAGHRQQYSYSPIYTHEERRTD